ncbi:TPR domain-containing glycosyltransferase [Paenibacillus baekrokdamisoli]|nr:TPR domain-containing glycosyltransferase [Paenibacillus baekrokdamisoli]
MIVKNEEKVLEQCLSSVQELADEIIIIDTGSTDGTKEIALKYTEQVFDFQWINDFSAARNEGINKATGKWILILDADEYVKQDEVDSLRNMLNLTETDKPVGIVVDVMNLTGNSLTSTTGFYQSSGTRIFTNGHGIHYENKIHEQVICQDIMAQFKVSFTVFHSGYVTQIAEEKKKSDRNMEIFNELKKTGKKSGPYEDFTIANELAAARKLKESVYYYSKCIKRSKITDPWYSHCCYRLIIIFKILKRYNEAYAYIEKGLQLWGQYTDFHYLKGAVLNEFGMYEQAVKAFETCLAIAEENGKQNKQFWLIDTDTCRLFPFISLAEIAYMRKDIGKTVFFLTKVLQENSKSFIHLYRLTRLLLQSEPPDEISRLLEQIYPQNQPFNCYIVFKVFLELGHELLASKYLDNCKALNLSMEANDMVRYALLTRNEKIASEWLEKLPSNSDSMYSNALIAALASKNPSWIYQYVKDSSQPYYDIGQYVICILEQNQVEQYAGNHQDQLYALIVDLFKLGYFEEFDQLMNLVENEALLNKVADFFYEENLLEIAIQYYSALINQEALSAAGYMNVANLYLSQNEEEEGLMFMQKSIDMDPAIDRIPYLISLLSDTELISAYQDKFADLHAGYNQLPFIKNLNA